MHYARKVAPLGLVLAVIMAMLFAVTAQSDPGTGLRVPSLAEHNALEQRVTAAEAKNAEQDARLDALEASPTPDPEPTTEPTPTPDPTTEPTPTPDPTTDPDPDPEPVAGDLPYSADSFFKSRVDGASVPVDATLTAQMQNFMMNGVDPDQAGITWPKINLNPGWSGHNYVHREGKVAPVWKLVGTNTGISNSRLDIVKTQGVHIADSVWDSVPTGTQDRLLVLQDHVFGYTVQCADVAPDRAARTWTASNCGIMWHSSNGLDYRNPKSNDDRNFTSRGRVVDAMQIPRAELDRAIADGTGVGHVLHLFWVQTNTASGFTHPMVGDESGKAGWGGEGWRLRIKPNVDLVARGLTGGALAIARTLQQNGGYIGDNSGSATQIKVGPPEDYVGTNLATDAFKGKLSWNDFEVVQPGWQ